MRSRHTKRFTKISLAAFGVFLISLFILSLVSPETTYAQPSEQTDACVLQQDAQNSIWVKGATPMKKVAVVTGLIKGSGTLERGECAGTEIGLNPYRNIITLIMNEEGEKKGEIYIPPTSANSGFMQMVDLATCKAGEVKDITYTDSRSGAGCVYTLPIDAAPKMYSGKVAATGTVFQSAPFCSSTLKITGDATVTVFGGAAQVVQNLTRVFGTPGDGCYSGFSDNHQNIFTLDVEKENGSLSVEGIQKGSDDTYRWSLSGNEQSLSGSFVNDHHYCCGRGDHTGTAEGNVTLTRQNEGN